MKKILMLLMLLIICVFAVSGVSANEDILQDNSSVGEIIGDSIDDVVTENGDIEVIENANEELIDSDESSNFRPIQDEINTASPGDTVYLNGSTYSCDYLVVINKTITIDGNGSTLIFDGSDKDCLKRCFKESKIC